MRGSFSTAEASSRTDRTFVKNYSWAKPQVIQSLEPGWFQHDRERSELTSNPGGFRPEECAFSSSPVLIVNHVTEKNKRDDFFGLLCLWLPIPGFNSPDSSLRVGGWCSCPSLLGGQGLVTRTSSKPIPEHVIFHPAMWVWSLDQVLLTLRF